MNRHVPVFIASRVRCNLCGVEVDESQVALSDTPHACGGTWRQAPDQEREITIVPYTRIDTQCTGGDKLWPEIDSLI